MEATHLNLLKKSVDAWNEWRIDMMNVKPNLSGADLRGLDLYMINLDEADLTGANLQGVNLRKATAKNAIFKKAVLERANLEETNLDYADFSEANIKRSTITHAKARNASFAGADLSGTDLCDTTFENSNLRNTVLYHTAVDGTNFDDTNIYEAEFHEDHFKGAIMPPKPVREREKSLSPLVKAALASIALIAISALLFVLYVISAKPDNSYALNSRIKAGYYLRLGQMSVDSDTEKATRLFEQSLTYNPDNAEAYYMLGQIYKIEKKVVLASICYQIYLELSPADVVDPGAKNYVRTNEERVKKYLNNPKLFSKEELEQYKGLVRYIKKAKINKKTASVARMIY